MVESERGLGNATLISAAMRPGRAVITKMVSAKRMASSIEWVTNHSRRPTFFDQPSKLLLEHKPSLCVQRPKRFVKQQDVGLHYQRPRETNSLTHAPRKLTWVLGFEAGHINLGKASASSFDTLLACDPSDLKAKGDIVGNSAPRKQIEALPHRSHPRWAGNDACLSVNKTNSSATGRE